MHDMSKEKGRIWMQRHVFDVYPKDSETIILLPPEEGSAHHQPSAIKAKQVRPRPGCKDSPQRPSARRMDPKTNEAPEDRVGLSGQKEDR